MSILILLGLATVSMGYRVSSGHRNLLPFQSNSTSWSQTEQNTKGRPFRMMGIYPYRIYEYQSQQSSNNLQKSFYFLKTPYDDLSHLIQMPNMTLYSDNQQQILYSLLPEVIVIKSEQNEQIELQLLSSSIDNHMFYVSNKTQATHLAAETTSVNFYSLNLHRFIYSVVTKAEQSFHKNWMKQFQQFLLADNNSHCLQANSTSDPKCHLKKAFLVQKVLQNSSRTNTGQLIDILLSKAVTKTTTDTTKWRALFDGIYFRYFSASLIRLTSGDANEASSSMIEMQSLQMREDGRVKRNRTTTFPLSEANTSQIEVMDICSCQLYDFVMFSSPRGIYLIDISKSNWKLARYYASIHQAPQTVNQLFFNKDCSVHQLKASTRYSELIDEEGNSSISIANSIVEVREVYYYSMRKMFENRNRLDSMRIVNHDYAMFCFQSQACSVYNTKTYQEVSKTEGKDLASWQSIKARTVVENSSLVTVLEMVDGGRGREFIIEINSHPLEDANQTRGYSMVPRVVYPLDAYHNYTQFLLTQMDRVIFQLMKQTSHLNPQDTTQLFDQIFKIQKGQHCYHFKPLSPSQTEVDYNMEEGWNICSFDIQTNKYIQMKVSFPSQPNQFKLFQCSAGNKFGDNPKLSVECIEIGGARKRGIKDISFSLYETNLYRIYLVKQPSAHSKSPLPIFNFKDIQKEQIQIASTIFFFIMLSLSLILIAVICFVVVKNLLVVVLIYYGYIEERGEPTYPLNWFSLKTKIKRLTQMGVLKYVNYQPSMIDATQQGNQCCFCLEVLRPKIVVAQLYCSHEFHRECFNEWVKSEPNTRCPTCRRAFTRTAVQAFQNGFGSDQELPL